MTPNAIINQDCRLALADMPEIFNCCISSPPYWSLRDYGLEALDWGDWKGCLGLEPTPELFIKHLCDIYDQVKRVMRKDGTVWVNLGDSYGTHQAGNKTPCGLEQRTPASRAAKSTFKRPKAPVEKSLVGIPEMFVLEMQRRGWIRRATIIWVKGLSFCENYDGSCMPDSAKDRPNKNGFEYIYLFTKSKKYWFEMQYEEGCEPYSEKRATRPQTSHGKALHPSGQFSCNLTYNKLSPLGRQFRNVWLINPQPCKEAHFATFPEKLVEICLKAGCPEFVCKKCGLPRTKIYEPTEAYKEKLGTWTADTDKSQQLRVDIGFAANTKQEACTRDVNFKGYTDCGCNADWRPGLVLDMFRWLWNCWGSSCKNAA